MRLIGILNGIDEEFIIQQQIKKFIRKLCMNILLKKN